MQDTRRSTARLLAATAAIILLRTTAVQPQDFEPVRTGEGVLFIGNSLTSFFGPLPSALQAVYRAADPHVNVAQEFDNTGKSCGILKEYAVLDSVSARVASAIREARWKYVVLQTWHDAFDQYDVVPDESVSCSGAPTGYPQNQDTLIKYFGILDDSIRAVGAQTILYAPHFDSWNYVDNRVKAVECYTRLRQEEDVPRFVPLYLAYDSVRADYPPDNWRCPGQTPEPGGFIDMLYSDCVHQGPNGMALDAFTWYTVLTGGASPVGLNPRFPSGGVTVEPDTSLFSYLAEVGHEIGRRILADMGYTDDLEPPSAPTYLETSGKTASSITLTWAAATDDIGVTGYQVLVDGIPYDTTASTTMTITGVDMAEDHNLTVQAFDAAGHTSVSSHPVSTGATLRYEAENHWRSYPDRNASLNPFVNGYSGTSCVRVRRVGSSVVFRVYCPTAGTRAVTLRYNIYVWSGETDERNISVHVNGDSATQATLTSGGNKAYNDYVHDLALTQGYNTIQYRFEPPDTALADTGEINIDCITVEQDGVVGIAHAASARAARLRGVRIVPDRVTGRAGVVVSSTGPQSAVITVTDMAGRTLRRLSTRLGSGASTVMLDGAWLWNRLCLVHVETESGRVTRTMLLTQ